MGRREDRVVTPGRGCVAASPDLLFRQRRRLRQADRVGVDEHGTHSERGRDSRQCGARPVAEQRDRLARREAGRDVHRPAGSRSRVRRSVWPGRTDTRVGSTTDGGWARSGSSACIALASLRCAEKAQPRPRGQRRERELGVNRVEARVIVVDEEAEQPVLEARQRAEADVEGTVGEGAECLGALSPRSSRRAANSPPRRCGTSSRSSARTSAIGRPTSSDRCSWPACPKGSTVQSVVSTTRSSAESGDSPGRSRRRGRRRRAAPARPRTQPHAGRGQAAAGRRPAPGRPGAPSHTTPPASAVVEQLAAAARRPRRIAQARRRRDRGAARPQRGCWRGPGTPGRYSPRTLVVPRDRRMRRRQAPRRGDARRERHLARSRPAAASLSRQCERRRVLLLEVDVRPNASTTRSRVSARCRRAGARRRTERMRQLVGSRAPTSCRSRADAREVLEHRAAHVDFPARSERRRAAARVASLMRPCRRGRSRSLLGQERGDLVCERLRARRSAASDRSARASPPPRPARPARDRSRRAPAVEPTRPRELELATRRRAAPMAGAYGVTARGREQARERRRRTAARVASGCQVRTRVRSGLTRAAPPPPEGRTAPPPASAMSSVANGPEGRPRGAVVAPHRGSRRARAARHRSAPSSTP